MGAFSLGGAAVAALACLAVVAWHAVRRLGVLQERLVEQDQRLDALAATSRDWLWRATSTFELISCAGAVRDVLGYEPTELVGQGLLALVDARDRRRARELFASAASGPGGWTDERLVWQRASGGSVALQSSATPIRDAAGHLLGFQGICLRVPDRSSAAEVRRAEVRRRTLEAVARPGGLTVARQPIVDLGLGRLIGVEALSRFPGSGVRPDRWFAQAHDAGIGVDLERHALSVALETLADLPEFVYLSVNASPGLILDPTMRSLLARPGLPLHRMVLEITEHTEISDYAELAATLLPQRARGLRVAVDDAGAGYASFHHVLRLRPDIIKLDRSLVTGLDEDGARRAFVTAIVALAAELNAAVTAEGVETTPELRVLRALGVDSAQGYLLARPAFDREALADWQDRDWLLHAGLTLPERSRVR